MMPAPTTAISDLTSPFSPAASVGGVSWQPYRGTTVVGDVRILRGERDLYAYLPPSHGSGKRFPVVVMHDGLNLFDEPLSHAGEWQVDETMEALAAEGVEAIVVGIPQQSDRRSEYAGPTAEAYLRFLVDTVLPQVREAFDTDDRREATGLAGSSLGGAISLHGLYAHRDTFGFAGVFSPAFSFDEGRLFDLVTREPPPAARIYMDVGGNEDREREIRERYVTDYERMCELLKEKGFEDNDLRTVLDADGIHHESAWARRLPDALRFLLRG
jgi:predicted alpha/beta superfamily hydrolase